MFWFVPPLRGLQTNGFGIWTYLPTSVERKAVIALIGLDSDAEVSPDGGTSLLWSHNPSTIVRGPLNIVPAKFLGLSCLICGCIFVGDVGKHYPGLLACDSPSAGSFLSRHQVSRIQELLSRSVDVVLGPQEGVERITIFLEMATSRELRPRLLTEVFFSFLD